MMERGESFEIERASSMPGRGTREKRGSREDSHTLKRLFTCILKGEGNLRVGSKEERR